MLYNLDLEVMLLIERIAYRARKAKRQFVKQMLGRALSSQPCMTIPTGWQKATSDSSTARTNGEKCRVLSKGTGPLLTYPAPVLNLLIKTEAPEHGRVAT